MDIVRVQDRRTLRRFVEAPWPIYANDPNWVPPLLVERMHHFDARKNPYFNHAEVAFWLALHDGEVVGRISAQIDDLYRQRHGAATGFFGCLEGINDPAVFAALLATAESWLKAHGLTRIIGPFSLSINDECGLLIRGFDTPPQLMMGHARPYYARHLEDLGYSKLKDLLAYWYDTLGEFSPEMMTFFEKASPRYGIEVRSLDRKRYRSDIATIVDIFNDAWAENWGFVPFTEAEMHHLAASLRPLLHDDDVAIASVDGEPLAMAVGLINLNELIADLNGRLLPLGWVKLLARLRAGKTKTGRMPLMGVRRRLHGSKLSAALLMSVIIRVRDARRRRGTKYGELSWVLEENLVMRQIIEKIGGEAYKTYRLYQKDLV